MTVAAKYRDRSDGRHNARDRILTAASEIAHDIGPANLALDAVAARAGISKGGLLYHFPAKVDLLEALVEAHLKTFEAEFERRQAEAAPPPGALETYLDLSLDDCEHKAPPSAGVLAAMVQNPEMLRPIRRFKRKQLDRLKASTENGAAALLLFLALEGIRSMKLLDMEVLDAEETATVVAALRDLIARG